METIKSYMPDFKDMPGEAKKWWSYMSDYIPDATDPGCTGWEKLKTPTLILIFIVIYAFVCAWLVPSMEKGRPGLSCHRLFLYFQVLGVAVNLSLFLTALMMWYAQGKFIRLLSLLLETLFTSVSMAPLLKGYVILKVVFYFYYFMLTVMDEYNPMGRSIKLFHQGLRPIYAWVCLKYFPGGIGGKVSPMMAVDMTFDFIIHLYGILDRQYSTVYTGIIKTLTKIVCFILIIMHFLTLYRLSVVAYNSGEDYSFSFLGWILFYMSFAIFCLMMMLLSLMYSSRDHGSGDDRYTNHHKTH